MVWRRLLYAYLVVSGSLLWLLWALVQTLFLLGEGRHLPRRGAGKDPGEEGYSASNCFFWALGRFIDEGGEFTIRSSPRLPVWRAEWTPRGKRERWHFEPASPRRGLAGIWHTYWHAGRPERSDAKKSKDQG